MKFKRSIKNIFHLITKSENSFQVMKNYIFKKSYKIKVEDAEIIGERGKETISIFSRLIEEGWSFKPCEKEEYYIIQKDGVEIITKGRSPALIDDLQGIKPQDVSGSNVIEVGGYLGQTTAIMKKWGADKIIVYEPVEECYSVIEDTAKINGWSEDIHIIEKAVGKKEKIKIKSNSEPGEMDFGLNGNSYNQEFPSETWEDVIERGKEENIDIIKSNCEGVEKHLKNVSSNKLNNFDKWFITAHSEKIAKQLTDKFEEAGFVRELNKSEPNQIELIFKKL